MPSRDAIVPKVFINGEESEDVRIEEVTQGFGGQSLDTCTFTIDDRRPLANMKANVGVNAECVVVQTVNNAAGKVLHWGKVGSVGVSIGSDDRRTYTSRLEHHHFGRPLFGMIERDPRAVPLSRTQMVSRIAGKQKAQEQNDQSTLNTEPLVFNPRIRGVVAPNMHPLTRSNGVHLFIHPEATRSLNALEAHGLTASGADRWTLLDAVRYICFALNSGEQYVKNPTPEHLKAILADIAIDNVALPHGIYLPQALDRLLGPYGGTWYVEHVSRKERRIKLVRRGDGPQKTVTLQKPGEKLANPLPRSNVKRTRMDFNTSAAVNAVHAVGDFKYVEATWELVPAWESKDDTLDVQLLAKTSEEYNAAATVRYQRVWRDWVLNEARDYEGPRSSWNPAPQGHKSRTPYDFAPIFGHALAVRRREFLPTLTLAVKPVRQGRTAGDEDGDPIGETAGVHVEWSDDRGVTWRSVAELGTEEAYPVHVLRHECGIRFDGRLPPEPLFLAGIDRARVRVTATIRDDERLEYFASSTDGSPVTDATTATLDCTGRFQHMKVAGRSIFWGYLARNQGLLAAREVDDSDRIKAFATGLVKAWDMADASGSIVLEGLDQEQYALGDIITSIVGRSIDFNCRAGQHGPRYPQITGLKYDFTNQQRVVSLHTFRDDEAMYAL